MNQKELLLVNTKKLHFEKEFTLNFYLLFLVAAKLACD
jgi:hypothetical protein